MSAIVWAIILVVGYSVVFVVKSLLSDHSDVKGTPVGGEVFPKIDIYNREVSDECVEKRITSVTKPDVKKKQSKSVESMGESPVSDVAVEKGNKVNNSLRNRSEAKRAFIHAEILNRKY